MAGTTASGSYYNQRTGTSGSYNAGRQYNAYTGNATRGYDRTFNTPSGASGNVARASNYNTYTGQRSYGSSVSVAGAGGSSIDRNTAATAGPQGYARGASTTTYNARTGQTNSWQSASVGNNHYADVNGNVYRNTGSGWEQHNGAGGWQSASGSNEWAQRESQARATGEDRWGGFSSSEAGRFGEAKAARTRSAAEVGVDARVEEEALAVALADASVVAAAGAVSGWPVEQGLNQKLVHAVEPPL